MAWTKLHDKLADSEHFADLVAQHGPWTGLVWCLILAKGGVWGRLPRAPRLLRHHIAGLLDNLSLRQLEKSVQALLEAGMVSEYTDAEGHEVLQVAKWWDYNNARFAQVGRPEYGHPPDFIPPPDLAEYLLALSAKPVNNRTLEGELLRLRLTPEHMVAVQRWYNGCGTVVEPENNGGTTNPQHRRLETRLETRDVDVEGGGGIDVKAVDVGLEEANDLMAAAAGRRLEEALNSTAPKRAYPGEDQHIILQENGELRGLLQELCPEMSVTELNRWTYEIARHVADPNYPLDKQEMMAFLREPQKAPSLARKSQDWLAWAERTCWARRKAEDPLLTKYAEEYAEYQQRNPAHA